MAVKSIVGVVVLDAKSPIIIMSACRILDDGLFDDAIQIY